MTFDQLDTELEDCSKKLDTWGGCARYEVEEILNLIRARFKMMDEENASLRNHIGLIYDDLAGLTSDVRQLKIEEVEFSK